MICELFFLTATGVHLQAVQDRIHQWLQFFSPCIYSLPLFLFCSHLSLLLPCPSISSLGYGFLLSPTSLLLNSFSSAAFCLLFTTPNSSQFLCILVLFSSASFLASVLQLLCKTWAPLRGFLLPSLLSPAPSHTQGQTGTCPALRRTGAGHRGSISHVVLHSWQGKKVKQREWEQNHSSKQPWVLQSLSEALPLSSLPCERKRRCWRESPALSLLTQVGTFHCRQFLCAFNKFRSYLCTERIFKASNQTWKKFPGSCRMHITAICIREQRKKGKQLCWISSVIFKGPPYEMVVRAYFKWANQVYFPLLFLWSSQAMFCTVFQNHSPFLPASLGLAEI